MRRARRGLAQPRIDEDATVDELDLGVDEAARAERSADLRYGQASSSQLSLAGVERRLHLALDRPLADAEPLCAWLRLAGQKTPVRPGLGTEFACRPGG
jgi:hypothetical protein